MLLTEETTEHSFTCPNAACKRVFGKPIKALNLQLNPEKSYDACPYCLTEIVAQNQETIEARLEKPFSCGHHLGYLYDRSTKTEIPDECMVCKEIIPCMMKNTKI